MIFITGGTGLVGSHILLQLCQKGERVLALRRNSSTLEICRRVFSQNNSKDLFKSIDWVNGDLNNIPMLEKCISRCEYVIHAAALVSFHPEDKKKLVDININGTANVMNISIDFGIKKCVYVSSIATLGRNSTDEIVDENCNFKLSNLESNYSISKYMAEQEVWRASNEGLDVIIVNPSVILGPGDWVKGSSRIFHSIYKGLRFFPPGKTGFVDVYDVSAIIVKLIFLKVSNERFILNGINTSYESVFNLIADNFNIKRPNIRVTPFLKEIGWRIEKFRSLILQRKSLITKETAESGMRESTFSSKKVEKLLNYKFRTLDDTVANYCKMYIKDLG